MALITYEWCSFSNRKTIVLSTCKFQIDSLLNFKKEEEKDRQFRLQIPDFVHHNLHGLLHIK